jgi:hypothetical protein
VQIGNDHNLTHSGRHDCSAPFHVQENPAKHDITRTSGADIGSAITGPIAASIAWMMGDSSPTARVSSIRCGRSPMVILQIEHPVLNFDAWKEAFDSDPVGRERSGVRRHRVLRPINDPHYAMVDLEFDSPGEAEAFLAGLRMLWDRVQGTIIEDPRARIVETIESKEY